MTLSAELKAKKICVYGAGAIGGLIAAKLAQAGLQVSCIARGPHLDKICKNSLLLLDNNKEIKVNILATDDPAELGEQDIVFVALKAHSLADNAVGIGRLLGPDTCVVAAQNGLPWWYHFGAENRFPGPHLDSVDPGGTIWSALGPERAIGVVIYPAASLEAPGVVRHISGNRFSIGEPKVAASPRLAALTRILEAGNFEVTPNASIRAEIWLKLSVNAAINPLSLVHQTTIGTILGSPSLNKQLGNLIAEAQQIAQAVGVEPLMSAQQLVAVLDVVKAHKTSMLIDYEQGRPLELAALTGAVVEVAQRLNIPAPGLQALLADAHAFTNASN